jgi:hypothetical protein
MLEQAGLQEIDHFIVSIEKPISRERDMPEKRTGDKGEKRQRQGKNKHKERETEREKVSISCEVSILIPTEEMIIEEHGEDSFPGPKRFAKDEVIVCITNIDDVDEGSFDNQQESSRKTSKGPISRMKRESSMVSDKYDTEIKAVSRMLQILEEESERISVSHHPSLSLNKQSSQKRFMKASEDSQQNASESENGKETSQYLEIQPTLYQLAMTVCDKLAPTLFNLSYQPVLMNQNMDDNFSTTSDNATETDMSTSLSSKVRGIAFKHLKIRLLGHSIAGGVASLSAMMLDGLLDPTRCPATSVSTSTAMLKNLNQSHGYHYTSMIAGHPQSLPIIGGFCQHVKCMTFGSPPCISRSVVPMYISSIMCGDDLMSRLKVSAWKQFESRLTHALEAGAGRKGLSWMATPGLFTKVAGKFASSRHYFGFCFSVC